MAAFGTKNVHSVVHGLFWIKNLKNYLNSSQLKKPIKTTVSRHQAKMRLPLSEFIFMIFLHIIAWVCDVALTDCVV